MLLVIAYRAMMINDTKIIFRLKMNKSGRFFTIYSTNCTSLLFTLVNYHKKCYISLYRSHICGLGDRAHPSRLCLQYYNLLSIIDIYSSSSRTTFTLIVALWYHRSCTLLKDYVRKLFNDDILIRSIVNVWKYENYISMK